MNAGRSARLVAVAFPFGLSACPAFLSDNFQVVFDAASAIDTGIENPPDATVDGASGDSGAADGPPDGRRGSTSDVTTERISDASTEAPRDAVTDTLVDAATDAPLDVATQVAVCGDGRVEAGASIEADAEAAEATSDEAVAETDAADATPDASPEAAPTWGSACATSDAGLGGAGLPPGTLAAASGGVGADAIASGNPSGWNAEAYTGWIEAYFPSPVTMMGLQLVAGAGPTATETYVVTGFIGSTSVPLGSWTYTVDGWGVARTLPRMHFGTAATYDAIRIDIPTTGSWVAINSISILTASCP